MFSKIIRTLKRWKAWIDKNHEEMRHHEDNIYW